MDFYIQPCKLNVQINYSKGGIVAKIYIPETGKDYIDTITVYYNGNGIFLTHQSGVDGEEEGRDKDFQIELTPKDALNLIEELKQAINDTSLDIAEIKQKATM